MFTIRPFYSTDADYKTMIEIDTAVFAEYPMTVEEWRHIDENRDPQYLHQREMIELNGQVIAFGDYGQRQWSFHPRKYFFNVYLHPEREHPGIRELYLDHVQGVLVERDPLALMTGMLEDREAHLHFLAETGFQEVMRSPLSELDVTAFDAAPFASISEKMREANIMIVSLRELPERDSNWQRKLHDLYWAIEQDVPAAEPPVQRTFEEFLKAELGHPNLIKDGWFVALDGDQFVGLSFARIDPLDQEKLSGNLTGVIRSHRRMGIATALKLRLINFARQYGAKTLTTGNEENNPMYTLNLALGFKPKPAWVEFEKPLQDE